MLLLEMTVLNVAVPAIQRSLHSSFSDLQWVVDAYSLTLAILLLAAGLLGDVRGRPEVFTIGLAVFHHLVVGLWAVGHSIDAQHCAGCTEEWVYTKRA
jgi:MFS family permease